MSGLVPLFKKYSQGYQQIEPNKSVDIGLSAGVSQFSNAADANTSSALLFNSKFNTAYSPFVRVTFVLQNEKINYPELVLFRK